MILTGLVLGAFLQVAGPRNPVEPVGGWTSGGPYGGTIEAIAVDPGSADGAYAATSNSEYATTQVGGVFRTEDGGRSWRATGLRYVPVYGLAVAPSAPAILFAATFHGVWRSSDAGVTWDAVLTAPFAHIAVDPSNSTIVYVGIAEGLMKSVDGGSTWAPVSALGTVAIDAICFDSASPPALHVAMRSATFPEGHEALGFGRSEDGGNTWIYSSSGFLDTGVQAMVAHPVDSSTLYAASTRGVLKTSDRGQTWAVTPAQPAYAVRALAIDPAFPSTVYAATGFDANIQPTPPGGGLFFTQDGGLTWSQDPALNLSLRSLGGRASSGGFRLYAGSLDFGVFRSDAGAAWSQVNDGIRSCSSLSVALDPSQAKTAYALTTAGFARTADGGETWTVDRSSPTSAFGALAVSPMDSRVIFAAGAKVGLLRSRDAGSTWETAFEPGPGYAAAVAFDEHDPSTVYLADYWPLKSSDGGVTWRVINNGVEPPVQLLAVDSRDRSILVSSQAFGSSNSFYRSTDAGENWVEDTLVGSLGRVSAIVPDPGRPGTIWVGTESGLIRSQDSGESWTGTGFSQPVAALAVDGLVSGVLYLAGADGQLFRSRDEGGSWEPFDDDLPGLPIRALAADPSGSFVYAATEVGVYEIQTARATRVVPLRPVRGVSEGERPVR